MEDNKLLSTIKISPRKKDTTEPLRFIPEHHGHIDGYMRIFYGHVRFITLGLTASQTVKV